MPAARGEAKPRVEMAVPLLGKVGLQQLVVWQVLVDVGIEGLERRLSIYQRLGTISASVMGLAS